MCAICILINMSPYILYVGENNGDVVELLEEILLSRL